MEISLISENLQFHLGKIYRMKNFIIIKKILKYVIILIKNFEQMNNFYNFF